MGKNIDGNLLYRKIAGHSYYHGDAILTAISIMQEEKEYNHDVPYADVKPVIHARLEYPKGTDIPNCSNCGKWVDILQGTAKQNYCMNCGAIFDLKN